MLREPAVLQIQLFDFDVSQLMHSFQGPTSVLNKTQLTFPPPTHNKVQELHISRKLPAREPSHGPQHMVLRSSRRHTDTYRPT